MLRIKTRAIFIVLFLVLAGLISPVYATDDKVNINTASKEELITLKYVGEATAEKIIEYRSAHPFVVPEDIMKVKGVGQKTFDVNKDRICCGES
ncbi:MAG: ComEA family DNA-binding protein [Desulfobacter sp.]|nr:ComEA family DNA-binding protein [Desulfobacter sp.]WDP85956.1 MAG: ComEA family DNA-binding protein [Desulfobacter sp.]